MVLARETPAIASAPLLDVRGFGIGFGTRVVLAEIDLRLDTRGTTVLMGPSGTGKSTLLRYLAGVPGSTRRRHWGQVDYLGSPLGQAGTYPVLAQQHARELGLPLLDNLASGLRAHGPGSFAECRAKIGTALHALGLQPLADRLDRTVSELSTMQIRLVSILRLAFSGAPLLLIDEPTSGLEPRSADQLLEVIERIASERACLVTLHNQAQARRLARRVVLMAGGRIQADAPTIEFFTNAPGHPVLAQFLRTGSCSVPAPDALADDLDEGIPPPPPLPASASSDLAPPPARSAAVHPPLDDGGPDGHRGPNGFHWLVRGKLAGCPMPGVVAPIDHDLALLKGMGVTLLINLTERETDPGALARHGLKAYWMRVEDRHAPPLMWAKLLLARMDASMHDGEVLAIHCLAGLGRTGTILAAWLIHEGLTADEALRRLRMIDAGFVQSREQEDLLHELETNLLIRVK